MQATAELIAAENTLDEIAASYHSQGFVNVRQLLTPDEVATFEADAKEWLAREETVPWEEGDGLAMDWVEDCGLRSEVMRGLTFHPRIVEIAERLADGPLRLFKSELFRKPTKEKSAITPIHYDEPSHPFAGRPVTLTAWVALTDVAVERGCMSFVPGSHRVAQNSHDGKDNGADPYAYWPELRWWPHVTVPMKAGDVSFHHARVVHWAGANHTDVDRLSLSTVYMDADATYAPNFVFSSMFPDDDLGGRKPGERIHGERFPRIRDGR